MKVPILNLKCLTICKATVRSLTSVRARFTHFLFKFICLISDGTMYNTTDGIPASASPMLHILIQEDFRPIKKNAYITFKPIRMLDLTQCDCKYWERCGKCCINRYSFIECNPKTCPCGVNCRNMNIQNGAAVSLRPFITTKGLGLKTEHAIKKGTFIIEYMGEVVTENEFKYRMATIYSDRVHHYGMCLDKYTVIDSFQYGNDSRYINHSCSPNGEVQKWIVDGLLRIAIYAKRNIQPNEEITFDYNFALFNQNDKQVCKCGSKNCRGFIIGSKYFESDDIFIFWIKQKKTNYVGLCLLFRSVRIRIKIPFKYRHGSTMLLPLTKNKLMHFRFFTKRTYKLALDLACVEQKNENFLTFLNCKPIH